MLIAMGCLLLSSAPSRADLVYENPWDNLATDAGAFSQANQLLAGEFVLGAAADVNRATWYGTMFAPDPLNTGDTWDFDVVFRSDAGGLPDGVLASRSVAALVTDTGVGIMGERVYLFDATFGNVALSGATSYWFTAENTGTEDTFRWTRATAGLGSALSTDGGATWSNWDEPARTPLNFALYAGVTAVPEPTSIAFFSLGMAACACHVGRRRAGGQGLAPSRR